MLYPELHYMILIFTPHYDDVIMSEIASQITSLTIVYSSVHLGADQSKHQSSASLVFVWEIHRWPMNFPHKWPVTRKIFPFDDVIMHWKCCDFDQDVTTVITGHLQMDCNSSDCDGCDFLIKKVTCAWVIFWNSSCCFELNLILTVKKIFKSIT